jgi:hypothetical protein
LTGAFIVLLVGLSLSLLTFLCEKIHFRKWASHRTRTSYGRTRAHNQTFSDALNNSH